MLAVTRYVSSTVSVYLKAPGVSFVELDSEQSCPLVLFHWRSLQLRRGGQNYPYSALQWLRFQAVFTGVALAVCALSVIATLWLLRRTSVVALLSGRLPGKLVLVGVYLVRLGALIAVASMSIGALNYSLEWSKQRAEADSWESCRSRIT